MIASPRVFVRPFRGSFLTDFGNQRIFGPTAPFLIDENFSVDPSWVITGDSVVTGAELISTVSGGGADHQRQTYASQTEIWASWIQSLASESIPTSGNRLEGSAIGGSTDSRVVTVGVENASGILQYSARYGIDGGSSTIVSITAVPYVAGQRYKIIVHWVAATAPAANDGIVQVWIDNALRVDVSNADTDTITADRVIAGNFASSGTPDGVWTTDDIKFSSTGQAP